MDVASRSKPASPTLGTALRSIRRERHWSLSEASTRTGFSVATLSKVENGKRSLTYDKLLQLAAALDVDISRLFSSDPRQTKQQSVAGRRSVQKAREGFVVEAGVYTYRYLAQDLVGKSFTPAVMDLHARSAKEFPELLRHEGEEHAFVLEGEVVLHTDVYEPLHLKQGESVYFDSSTAHAYLNAGTGPARILCISSTSELRHPRAGSPIGRREPGKQKTLEPKGATRRR